MDKFDQHIIACLKDNARISNADIARQVGLSRTAVTERIRKLEDTQVISGYQVQLNEKPANVAAYFILTFERPRCEEVVHQLRAIAEVKSVDGISGEIDLIIYAEAASMADLTRVRAELEQLEELCRLQTHTVLKSLYRD